MLIFKNRTSRYLIFLVIIFTTIIILKAIISKGQSFNQAGKSFIFIEKFDRDVIEHYFPGKLLYNKLSSVFMVKLNPEIEFPKAGRNTATIYRKRQTKPI